MLHETHLVLCWDGVKFSLILNTFFQPSIMFSSHVKNINLAILSRLVSRVFPQIIQLDDLQRDRVLVWNCGYIFIYLIFASPEKANKKTQTESFVIRLSVGSTSTPVHVNNTVLSALSNGRFQINWRWTSWQAHNSSSVSCLLKLFSSDWMTRSFQLFYHHLLVWLLPCGMTILCYYYRQVFHKQNFLYTCGLLPFSF